MMPSVEVMRTHNAPENTADEQVHFWKVWTRHVWIGTNIHAAKERFHSALFVFRLYTKPQALN